MPKLKFKMNQCLPMALETLGHYRIDSVINEFLEKFKMSLDGNRVDKLADIKAAVLTPGKHPTFRDLSDYIDELKWHGKQHIFLFSLKGVSADYLAKLRDGSYIEKQLHADKLFNKNRLIWEETEPVLAGITHAFDTEKVQGKLIFKWIETREFEVLEKDPAKKKVVVIKKERAVNFFMINLNDGTAELRIQILQPNSINPLKSMVDFYKKEINRFIHLDYFTPVAMDPVIRTFLRTEQLPIREFQIIFAEKGKMSGKHFLPLQLKLNLLFRPFFSKEMKLCWESDQVVGKGSRVFFTLNGESDDILFNSITDQSKVEDILIRLRVLSTELIKMDELKALASSYPQHIRILSGIDFLFMGLKKLKIKVTEISEMGWLDQDTIKELFKIITEQFPEKFYLEGTDFDVLVIRNCFTLQGGLQECINRRLDTSKCKDILKPAATVTLIGILYTITRTLGTNMAQWIADEVVNKVIHGIPVFFIKSVLTMLLAVFIFGTTSIFRKIPKTVQNFIIIIFKSLQDGGTLGKKFNKILQKPITKLEIIWNKLQPTFISLISLIIFIFMFFLFTLISQI